MEVMTDLLPTRGFVESPQITLTVAQTAILLVFLVIARPLTDGSQNCYHLAIL
jgi:hypothetical protein